MILYRHPTVGVRMRIPIPRPSLFPLLAAALALLSGCGEGGETADADDALLLRPPVAVLASRAIEVDALTPFVTLGDEELLPVREGDVWRVVTTIPAGQSRTLVIRWTERFDGQDLPLARLSSELGPFDEDASVTLEPDAYVTEGDGLDADGTGGSNLAEREAGTNPFDANDPPEETNEQPSSGPGIEADRPADVLILPFDPASTGAPVIDGAFDAGIWDQATFAARDGERMLINRLLIDQGAEAPSGDPSILYTWFAMHDFTHLYLFVQFERDEGPFTPVRDSGDDFFFDDALSVYFDGDASRGAELDGVGGDDRAFSIPLLPQTGEGLPRVYATRPRFAPDVPPSLEYGVCQPRCGVTGWEIKIALADLNIVLDRPFGFEVHIDQDLDGGERDSRWGWAYPAGTGNEAAVDLESPALFGTATLASER